MIISDLEHLKVVDPKTNVVGGWIYKSADAYAYAFAYGEKAVAFTETQTFAKVVSISRSF